MCVFVRVRERDCDLMWMSTLVTIWISVISNVYLICCLPWVLIASCWMAVWNICDYCSYLFLGLYSGRKCLLFLEGTMSIFVFFDYFHNFLLFMVWTSKWFHSSLLFFFYFDNEMGRGVIVWSKANRIDLREISLLSIIYEAKK